MRLLTNYLDSGLASNRICPSVAALLELATAISLVVTLVGCANFGAKKSEVDAAAPTSNKQSTETKTNKLASRIDALVTERYELQRTLGERDTQLASFQLRLMEKEAQINQVRQLLSAQTQRLDDAIQEVVRAKAKLQTSSGRAASVTNLAEVAVDLKALQERFPEFVEDLQMLRAEQLLSNSQREFNNGNHSGAYYLASSAKSLIQALNSQFAKRLSSRATTREILFAEPLSLEMSNRSNVRAQPDIKSAVLYQLDEKARVTAYGYLDQWVRIESIDGTQGWVFFKLLKAP